MKALILENIQIDYFPGGAMEIAGSDQLIPLWNQLINDHEVVIAALEWHPGNHVSFAATHPWRRFGQIIEVEGLYVELFAIHCVQNTFGAVIHSGIQKEKIQHTVHKGTTVSVDNYSCFWDAGQKVNTGLHSFLQEKGITQLAFAGLNFERGIFYSVQDALALGYSVEICKEACLSKTEVAAYEEQLKELQKVGVEIVSNLT